MTVIPSQLEGEVARRRERLGRAARPRREPVRRRLGLSVARLGLAVAGERPSATGRPLAPSAGAGCS